MFGCVSTSLCMVAYVLHFNVYTHVCSGQSDAYAGTSRDYIYHRAAWSITGHLRRRQFSLYKKRL